MNFGESISTCLGKYGTFSGRASRSEYWWFYLFVVLMSWGASIVGAVTVEQSAGDIMSVLVNLAFFIPSLAVGARRLHDGGRSGWWQLLVLTIIGLIPLIVWWAQEGSSESNEYGPPPFAQDGQDFA